MRRSFASQFAALVLGAGLCAQAIAQSEKLREPFADDAKAGVALRSMWFDRELPNAKSQETWAAGAGLWGHTGYWRDAFLLGGRLYAELPLYGPDGKDGGLQWNPAKDMWSRASTIRSRTRSASPTPTSTG
ncbi:MAG: hypothetical protein WAO95_04660 [Burkholderiales bacterium]